MKRIILTLVLSFLSFGANAYLIDRGNGFIYDDDLDITWTQDANIFGQGNWSDAVAWADGLSLTHSTYGTFSDWRLPSMDVNGDNNIEGGGSSCESTGCPDNEMAHLYNEFISLGFCQSDNQNLVFTNMDCGPGSNGYWTSTTDWLDPNYALVNGLRSLSDGNYEFKLNPTFGALAVHAGDVAAVPIPAAVWLFGSGLGLLGWVRKRSV